MNPPPAIVSAPASSGDVLSWGVDIDRNRTDARIVLVSVEPISASGLEIVGGASYDPQAHRSAIGLVEDYPPEGYTLAPIDGTVVPPDGIRHVVFGVRLHEGSDRGWICGVRVTYEQLGRRYKLVLDYQLHVVPPGETQSPLPSLDSEACPGS